MPALRIFAHAGGERSDGKPDLRLPRMPDRVQGELGGVKPNPVRMQAANHASAQVQELKR